MKTKTSIVQPSRSQLVKLEDISQDDAPFRRTFGVDFWRTAAPRYPSRGQRTVRVPLDPEVSDWFRQRRGDPDAMNAVLRAYVEARKAEE